MPPIHTMTILPRSNILTTSLLHQIRPPSRFVCHQCRRNLLPVLPPIRLHLRLLTTRSRPPPSYARSLLTRLKRLLLTTSLSATFLLSYAYITDTRSAIHSLSPLVLRTLYPDAEDSHHAGNSLLAFLYHLNLHPRERGRGETEEKDLEVEVLDKKIESPMAISAGLDKEGEVVDALFALGASVVEIGGVTAKEQEGNERPRVWRVGEGGLVNRYGLNSSGADKVARRLRGRVRRFALAKNLGEREVLDGGGQEEGEGWNPGSLQRGKLLAVQIAKNAATPSNDLEGVVEDYEYAATRLAKYADVIVVNVSSPNTPGLRTLQAYEPLTRILGKVVGVARRVERRRKPSVLVKVSPDEGSWEEVEGVCAAVWESGGDGVVVGNTTTTRPLSLGGAQRLTKSEVDVLGEKGGYSGPEMFERTKGLVGRYRRVLDEMGRWVEKHQGEESGGEDGRVVKPKVIFASGGITDGVRALQVLEAGASVAMMYTGLVYGGAGTVTRMKGELRAEMKRRIEEAKKEEVG